MGDFINWAQTAPADTPLSQPLELVVRWASDYTRSPAGSSREWHKQSVLLVEPGDDPNARDNGMFANIWGATCDWRQCKGGTYRFAPSQTGAGMMIVADFKDATKRSFEFKDSCAISVVQDPPAPAAPPQQSQPAPQQGGQASMPPVQQPLPGQAPPQQNYQPSQPLHQAPPQQQTYQPEGYEPGEDEIPMNHDQQGQPVQQQQQQQQAAPMANVFLQTACAYVAAYQASRFAWCKIQQAEGVAPSREDLRATANSIMIQASKCLAGPDFGSGERNLNAAAPTEFKQASATSAGSLVLSDSKERAKEQLWAEGEARAQGQASQ